MCEKDQVKREIGGSPDPRNEYLPSFSPPATDSKRNE